MLHTGQAAARAKKEASSRTNTLNKNERGALWAAPLKPTRRHNKSTREPTAIERRLMARSAEADKTAQQEYERTRRY